MSTGDVAAFMRRIAIDQQLQGELAAVACTRGFVFTPEELTEVDFEAACGRMIEHPIVNAESPERIETDPGFGIIEVPA